MSESSNLLQFAKPGDSGGLYVRSCDIVAFKTVRHYGSGDCLRIHLKSGQTVEVEETPERTRMLMDALLTTWSKAGR